MSVEPYVLELWDRDACKTILRVVFAPTAADALTFFEVDNARCTPTRFSVQRIRSPKVTEAELVRLESSRQREAL